MKLKKTVKFIFLLIILICVSGCVKLNYNQSIDKEGHSNIELEMDISLMLTGMLEEMSNDSTIDNPCLDIEENKSEALLDWNIVCEYDGKGILKLIGSKVLTQEDDFFVEKSIIKTKYKYNPKNLLQNTNSQSGLNSEELESMSPAQLEIFGVEYKYTLVMPGEIISSNYGDIDGNKVVINLLEVPSEDEILIISESKNMLVIYTGIVILILLLLMILYILYKSIKKKKSNKVVNDTNLNVVNDPNEQMTPIQDYCKKYILQYRSNYSRESIKAELIKANVSEMEVENSLNKYF